MKMIMTIIKIFNDNDNNNKLQLMKHFIVYNKKDSVF